MNHATRTRIMEKDLFPLLDSLYRTARSMTGGQESAEDLVQDVSLKVFKYLHQFRTGTNFRAWVFRIMVNTHINQFHRKRLAPRSIDFQEFEPAIPDDKPTYLSKEDIESVREQIGDLAAQALDKVPHDFRIAFMLSTFADLSYREIAEITGVAMGTVMSRIFRARTILRSEIAAHARRRGVSVEDALVLSPA